MKKYGSEVRARYQFPTKEEMAAMGKQRSALDDSESEDSDEDDEDEDYEDRGQGEEEMEISDSGN